MFEKNYPNEPTAKAKVDSSLFNAKLLGKNKFGTVHLHGPFGNTNSNIKSVLMPKKADVFR